MTAQPNYSPADGSSTSALTKYDPAKRSVSSFPVHGDPWQAVAAWAQSKGYQPREPQTGNTKLFQKGSGFLTAPVRVQFTFENGVMHVQAYLKISLFARISALFMLPAEMHVNSGGFRAVIPRNMARKSINELLSQMGGQPIP